MKETPQRTIVLFLILLCILTRLPQILSPYLLLDGDECVLATMAKYLYHGKDFSLFFWGQDYGFSLIESAAIVPFYFLLGVTPVAVKLGMLLLWTTGVVFFYKTLVQINKTGFAVPVLITLLLIATPAWAIWSMKARGGYLTSFMLSSMITWLLLHKKYGSRQSTYIIVAVLLNLSYQSQPFWLAGTVPVLIYKLWQERSLRKVICCALPAVLLFTGFYYYKSGIPEGYTPDKYTPENKEQLRECIMRIPEYIYQSLQGNYYFAAYQSPNLFCAVFAHVFRILLYVVTAISLLALLFKRKGNGLLTGSGLSLLACAAYTLLTRDMQGRYLLPLTGLGLFTLQLVLNNVTYHKAIVVSTTVMIVTGLVAVITFWRFEDPTAKRLQLQQLITYLEQRDTYYVFVNRTMLPWQISFYSKEKIMARTGFSSGRFAPHHEKVDSAYFAGARTAFVGYSGPGEAGNMNLQKEPVNDVFFASFNPPSAELKKGFAFKTLK